MKKIAITFILLLIVCSFYSCYTASNLGYSSDVREANYNARKAQSEIQNNDSIPKKSLKYKPK
jgi:hypothetical protein